MTKRLWPYSLYFGDVNLVLYTFLTFYFTYLIKGEICKIYPIFHSKIFNYTLVNQLTWYCGQNTIYFMSNHGDEKDIFFLSIYVCLERWYWSIFTSSTLKKSYQKSISIKVQSYSSMYHRKWNAVYTTKGSKSRVTIAETFHSWR